MKCHIYTSLSLPSSDNETETENKLSISDYMLFKFNMHNSRCLLSSSCCIDGSQQNTDNSMRKAAGRK